MQEGHTKDGARLAGNNLRVGREVPQAGGIVQQYVLMRAQDVGDEAQRHGRVRHGARV
jgi:hypothetical protein